MHEYLRRLTAERTTLTENATTFANRAVAEERDLTETEQASIAEWQTRCGQIDAQLITYNDGLESTRAYAALLDRIQAQDERTPSPTVRSSAPAAIETTSWGRQFVDSDQYRTYTGHGQSGVVELIDYLETRAPITTAQLAIPHFVLPPLELQARSPLLEICGRVTVSSGIVDWVEIGADPAAAKVAEGAPKPEASIPLVPKSAALDTYAHWVQITRQALEDATYLQSIVEGKLRRGLLLAAEQGMSTAIQAASTQDASVPAGGTLLESIRKGVGLVQSSGYNPNAVALNPADWATLDVTVMGQTTSGPVIGASFWGLTPIAVPSIPVGFAYAGDFQSGATLFDRGVTNTFVTDSHQSLFISNILVILAEARLLPAVTEPLALAVCTVAP